MKNLVPLRVKIGLTPEGRAAYPEFNTLPIIQTSQVDWSVWVDTYGVGWHYDKKYGHREEGPDSPAGQQWGVLLVPEAFATEAVATFPAVCDVLDESSFETFYEERVTAHLPEVIVDEKAIAAFEVKERLGVPLTPAEVLQRNKALDPDDDTTPGVKRNRLKHWPDFKAVAGIAIVAK